MLKGVKNMDNLTKFQFQHQALNEISSFILQGMKGIQLYNAVARSISGAFGASSAAIVFYRNLEKDIVSVGSSFKSKSEELLRLVERSGDLEEAGYLAETGVFAGSHKGVFSRLISGDESIGLLCIGPKLSGQKYDEADLELLKLAGSEISLILMLERKLEQEKQHHGAT